MDVPLTIWLAVLGVIVAMLAIDLFAHRDAHVISAKEAAIWSAIWVAMGIGFGVIIWATAGAEFAGQYYAGYLIEKSLAVDNVFVWAIIFSYFAVPRQYQHRVLFYGVVGALVMRGVMIWAGSAAIKEYIWILYIFGAFLVFTGVMMMRHRNSHFDPSRSRIVQLFRRTVPMTDDYDGQRFLTRRNGALVATPLLLVLILVETTDLVFAVDSIPAIFAVTQETFLVFTANAFAILGLRAMYFLLADLMHRFIYLKLGLGLVLVWVGIKLVLQVDLYKMPTWLSLGVVATIITVAIVASLRATSGQPPVPHADADHDADQPGATPAKEAEGARATATTAEDASPTGTPTVAPHTSADEKEQVHG
jgi:tellurite resistance protein TerC